MTTDDVVLVSLLMIGNLLYWSPSRRDCWPPNWNISELSLSHGRHGGCGWSNGSFGGRSLVFLAGLALVDFIDDILCNFGPEHTYARSKQTFLLPQVTLVYDV